MDFKISIIEGQPIWDALPVGKIIHYPLEKRDYRPFAQVRMCVNQTDLFLRMWAFEARPSAQSALIARLNFDPENSVAFLEIKVDSAGGMICSVQSGEEQTPLALYGILPHLHSYRGEDLEGEYWGVMVQLPRAAIEKIYGADPIQPGYEIKGNLYKQDTSPNSRHMGSLFPANPEQKDLFGPSSFGSLIFVNY